MLGIPSPWRPLGIILLTQGFNRALSSALRSRQLDFLLRRVIAVDVEDIGLSGTLTLTPDGFIPCDPGRPWDLRFQGRLRDFLLLAAEQGDTALGLEVKNFLYAQEPILGRASLLIRLLKA
ncbi:MAG: hypothetical protein D6819_02630 [Gammaproteobacteria bacterium]|nr:MAG: hypothetical protein D6819_02630 [Gammaproteobacteria bacterium]